MKEDKTLNRITLGVVLDWIVGWSDMEYYQTLLLAGIADYARINDMNIICYVTGRLGSLYDWERSRNILFDFVSAHRIDGLIIPPSTVGIFNVDLLRRYSDIPVVTLGESYEDIPSVSIDNKGGMRQVMEHIIEQHCCKRIVFIRGVAGSVEAEMRYEVYRQALADHGIALDPDLVYPGDFIFDSGSKVMRDLLNRDLSFDAVVAANDNMAIGALQEYYKQKGRIPEIPITGFDDVEASRFHNLTTVRQSFYDEAWQAAKVLHQIIRGEKFEMKTHVSCELVLRSSCGCVPSIVKNVFTEHIGSEEPFAQAFYKQRDAFYRSIIELNPMAGLSKDHPLYNALVQYEDELLDALCDELCHEKIGEFLSVWNNLVYWVIMNQMNLSFLQELLSYLRKRIIAGITDITALTKADDLFQAARIQINEALQCIGGSLRFLSYVQNDDLDRLSEELAANLDLSVQMDILSKKLPQFGIRTFYISLYDCPSEPLNKSHLVLACTDGIRRHDLLVERFPTVELLPDSVMHELSQNRYNIVVQALHQGDNPLGFCIFGFDSKVNKAYEIVRQRLSVALKGTQLVQNITQQAKDLERQVDKRTKELSGINQQLVEEIKRREIAEGKLQNALAELAASNNELRYQSERDELTGLYNRRGFMCLGSQHYETSKIKQQGFLLIFADLDGLKAINDQYGHAEGDVALKETAAVLKKTFRNIDIVARIGGDEFTIIAVGASPDDEAMFRERLWYHSTYYNKKCEKPYRLSLSVGVAYSDPVASDTFSDVMKAADQALYEDKLKKRRRSLANVLME